MLGGVYLGGAVLGGMMSFLGFADSSWAIPAGPATAWANGNVKAAQQWTAAARGGLSQWTNGDVKTPTRFTAVAKNITPWDAEQPNQTQWTGV